MTKLPIITYELQILDNRKSHTCLVLHHNRVVENLIQFINFSWFVYKSISFGFHGRLANLFSHLCCHNDERNLQEMLFLLTLSITQSSQNHLVHGQ